MSPGYALPVYKQPLFTERNFGAKGGPTVYFEQDLPDFGRFRLRNVESACSEQALWLTQNTLLADEGMFRSVIQALAKVFGGKEQFKRGPTAGCWLNPRALVGASRSAGPRCNSSPRGIKPLLVRL